MSTDQAAVATVESLDEAVTDQSSLVRLWLDAIGIATSEEENWRNAAQNAFDLYRQSSDNSSTHRDTYKKFNILHANIETICPALYNSVPIPDVRRRFNDEDPIAKTVADIQERCLQYSVDSYDFDHVMKLATKDSELAGRSIDRVRYKPYVGKDGTLDYQEVTCEHVEWKHFRRGPGHVWDDVPWIAFELFLTRDELEKLSPKFGSQVNLDVSVNRPNDKTEDRNIPEIFKRARVWEIWDKDQRKVVFIAESFKERPIREEDDPLELDGFYPIPRPLYAVQTSNSLVPVVPYEIYKAQAEELEKVSQRIMALTEAVKAKALYDARITEMDRLEKADDADNIPIENIALFADGSKLADHVMFYPIEIIVAALEKLYAARDQIKQTIYEITGIADILRGQTDPNETLGAQQLKTQWGSLRIQNKQAEIARYARDIFRIKAELFASKFEPLYLQMMTGIPLVPQPTGNPQQDMAAQQQAQAVMQVLRSDKLRGFRVDVESDSTIRADLTRNQQNMTQFLQGTAQFAQAMGPIVMTFKEMTPAVIEVYSAFARNFKLGKQAEDALDKLSTLSQQAAQQPKPPDPQAQAEQAKLQQNEQQHEQAMQQRAVQHQQTLEQKAQQFREQQANDERRHVEDMQQKQLQHEQALAQKQLDQQFDREENAKQRDSDAQIKREQIASSKEPKTTIAFDASKAMEQMAPAMKAHMDDSLALMSKTTQALAQAAVSIERMAEVMAADSEIVRDPKTGRALRSRKILQQPTVN